ncbi:methionyl-tRNA formyltransferase [Candidatus Symbiobacter mobilis]|uniref:methionyl-tRNA formyltransferase n=1 Tax=Candidatus Symbiobacter mobilis TaxID=1436290 RepID=UPI00059BCDE3|nr:methionyl-tRNA formyltransferase [Candidatus Symbiobacter mobilis]
MRLVFAGTPPFAAQALAGLCNAGHEVTLVWTQPDRPAGRGMRTIASPVKEFAQRQGIDVQQPRSLRLDGKFPDDARAAQTALQRVQADAMVVAAYGLILPQWVLDTPRLGCLNIHASLLPRWRGAAPIQRAIEAGDTQTGVTIMQMDAGLDTGGILLAGSIPIDAQDTAQTVHDRLADIGAGLVLQALHGVASGKIVPTPQPTDGVCYAAKIDKHEAQIDWTLDAPAICRKVRAFQPAPGAHTTYADTVLKVWKAEATQRGHGEGACCGAVLDVGEQGIVVAAGNGTAVQLLEVQRAGGKRLLLAEFLRGYTLRSGSVLGT